MINTGKEWRRMDDDNWDHYSGLPSPSAYEDKEESQTVDAKHALSLRGWGMEVNEAGGGRFSLSSTKSTRALFNNQPTKPTPPRVRQWIDGQLSGMG